MKKALFLHGVFSAVLDEIIKSQNKNPGKVFYLQPYSEESIKQLKQEPPDFNSPLPLYISTTDQPNQICYSANIVGWDDKNTILPKRLSDLNEHIKSFQPKEGEIYFEARGKKCINLISIRNLRKLTNQFHISILIKQSNDEPLKPRPRLGRWSYVYAAPSLSIESAIDKGRLEEELEKSVSASLKDTDERQNSRLKTAPKIPERVQTVSFGFRRNPDVIAVILKRAKGKCELCGCDAPFQRVSDGSPYLEVHHWIQLSDGGEDTVENACALCPNCHKQAHFGKDRDSIKSNKSLTTDAEELHG